MSLAGLAGALARLLEEFSSSSVEGQSGRVAGFPQYEELCTIFGDAYATGEYAMGTCGHLTMSEENDNDGGDAYGDADGEDKHNVDKTPTIKRRRRSSTFDIANTCKALQDMLKSWTNQSTNVSATTQAPPPIVDTFSIGAMIDVLVSMPELEQDLYNKAVERACASAIWREAFIKSPAERRNGLLQSLK